MDDDEMTEAELRAEAARARNRLIVQYTEAAIDSLAGGLGTFWHFRADPGGCHTDSEHGEDGKCVTAADNYLYDLLEGESWDDIHAGMTLVVSEWLAHFGTPAADADVRAAVGRQLAGGSL